MSEQAPEEVKPTMEWDSQQVIAGDVIWWSRLDGRYQVEVHRDPKDEYGAQLHIFDHGDDDKLLRSEPVRVAYGAPFGPDMDDVVRWQEKAVAFLDHDQPV
jgi:hypothetical protein